LYFSFTSSICAFKHNHLVELGVEGRKVTSQSTITSFEDSNRDENQSKVVALIKTFQWYVAHHLHARKLGRFPTFNQITNLTPGLSFSHNLCFKNSNGSCEPILDIYIPRSFQCYKEIFNPMSFGPLLSPFEDSRVHWDSNSQNGNSLGSVGVHSLTFSCTPRSMKCDSQAHSWIAPL